MASTIFFITSLLLTITSVTAIYTTTKPTTATTAAIQFPATLLLPISTTEKNSPLEFEVFRPSVVAILVSVSVGAAYWWRQVVAILVLGLCSLDIALPCILKGIFCIQGGIVAQREVLGVGTPKITINYPNFPLTYGPVPQSKEKGKQKTEEEEEDKDEEEGRGGGDKGKNTEDGEDEFVDPAVQIRKYLSDSDASIGVLMEEVPVHDCPSWTTLAQRIHQAWKSIDWVEGEDLPENVDPSTCWPGHKVSYWSTEMKRLYWTQVDWNHAKPKLTLIRLVPDPPLQYHFF